MDRRKFITNTVRASILGGIVAISGKLLQSDAKEESCEYSFICSKCNRVSDCKLPEGMKYKEIQEKNK
jgi:hypothetical protein